MTERLFRVGAGDIIKLYLKGKHIASIMVKSINIDTKYHYAEMEISGKVNEKEIKIENDLELNGLVIE